MQRLDDAEFGRRQRERNLRANRRRRERLTAAGFCQWNLWIAEDVRQRAEQWAAQRNQSPSEFITALLTSGLNVTTTPATTRDKPTAAALNPASPPVDNLPLFAAPAPVDRDSRILALKREQPELSNYAIAARVGCSESTVRRLLKQSAIASLQ